MIPVKHFYMIRHGETEANAARLMAGWLDSPLTPNGIAQARGVQAIVKTLHVKPKIVIHSHLSRARDTASLINEALSLPMHEDPDYAEMHAGDWEGRPYAECQDIFRSWVDAPNGETAEQFFTRVRRAKKKALERGEASPLIVCHGGVMRAFWKIFGVHMPPVLNCQLFEFEPRLDFSEETEGFPWQVWRYDSENGVNRRPVDMSLPDSLLKTTPK